MYDLIVVGARVAGSPAAMLAARAGLRVLLLDRAGFPSDTLSTNYIHQPGCARLARWGLLQKVMDSGCPAIPRTRFETRGIVVEGGISTDYVQDAAYAPRRYVLDALLLEAARDAGAEFREHCTVVQTLTHDGRVAGVVLRNRSGALREERARLVVGADGMHSTIARLVDAEVTREDPIMTCAYYSFWQGLNSHYELYEGDDVWVGAVPTNDAILVATYFPQHAFETIRSRSFDAHLDAVATCAPALRDRMRRATQTGKLWGTGVQRNFFRRAAGPGWALVGDAGHHKDSISARGITDAFVQSELLIKRIQHAIHDDAQLDAALAEFARDRDTLMMPGYLATLNVAQMDKKDSRLNLLRGVAADPRLTALYFDVVAGIRPGTDLKRALDERIAATQP
ncbi:FAD-dependent oxidoreductase [Burkholderia metallica]|uniref:NAD(P)/FAD-dependent oxidoreductase n=1 Tax=Burkholderia metallica TaxID=488729 RepID=UPI00157B0E8D|nr:FAD-dependent oxidoreductase [Burkholderia metallica]NTZ81663.1 FAD-dependent oxidoreductase [Burkholderia metallica]